MEGLGGNISGSCLDPGLASLFDAYAAATSHLCFYMKRWSNERKWDDTTCTSTNNHYICEYLADSVPLVGNVYPCVPGSLPPTTTTPPPTTPPPLPHTIPAGPRCSIILFLDQHLHSAPPPDAALLRYPTSSNTSYLFTHPTRPPHHAPT